MRSIAVPAALLACAACSAPPPAESSPAAVATVPSRTARIDAAALVHAPPADWAERAAAVLAHPDAGAALLEALRAQPDAPGAPCAIAALGAVGGNGARRFLTGLLSRDGEVAMEAALALGRLGDADAVPELRAAMRDRHLDAAVRTAAAAALLDLRDDAAAVPFLAAAILAGTPTGIAERERLGLPDKPRWALERTIAIDAVARRTGGVTFGLDPDATWPALADAVADMTRALRSEGS